MSKLKEKLFEACFEIIDQKRLMVKKAIDEIQESMLSETKSSAGDKHETGRAMLQLEREKAGNQLAEIEKTTQILSKINPEASSKIIGLGSVVFTTQANYFIAVSAGELQVENQNFYAISANTPIGQLVLGKNVGDRFSFNGSEFKIVRII